MVSGDGAKLKTEADWGDKTGRGSLETERDLCGLESCCPPALAYPQQLSPVQGRLASKPPRLGGLERQLGQRMW